MNSLKGDRKYIIRIIFHPPIFFLEELPIHVLLPNLKFKNLSVAWNSVRFIYRIVNTLRTNILSHWNRYIYECNFTKILSRFILSPISFFGQLRFFNRHFLIMNIYHSYLFIKSISFYTFRIFISSCPKKCHYCFLTHFKKYKLIRYFLCLYILQD